MQEETPNTALLPKESLKKGAILSNSVDFFRTFLITYALAGQLIFNGLQEQGQNSTTIHIKTQKTLDHLSLLLALITSVVLKIRHYKKGYSAHICYIQSLFSLSYVFMIADSIFPSNSITNNTSIPEDHWPDQKLISIAIFGIVITPIICLATTEDITITPQPIKRGELETVERLGKLATALYVFNYALTYGSSLSTLSTSIRREVSGKTLPDNAVFQALSILSLLIFSIISYQATRAVTNANSCIYKHGNTVLNLSAKIANSLSTGALSYRGLSGVACFFAIMASKNNQCEISDSTGEILTGLLSAISILMAVYSASVTHYPVQAAMKTATEKSEKLTTFLSKTVNHYTNHNSNPPSIEL